jgi:hypothetical protein
VTFCTICGRDVLGKGKYCRYHQEALDSLQSSYEVWKKACGVSWEEYLEKLFQVDETGRWVKEVAEQIRSGNGSSAAT